MHRRSPGRKKKYRSTFQERQAAKARDGDGWHSKGSGITNPLHPWRKLVMRLARETLAREERRSRKGK